MSNIRITGLENVRKNLIKLAKKMPKEAKKALRKAAKPIQRDMKRFAPKDSGALRKSIATKIKISKRTGNVYAIVGVRNKFATTSSGKIAKRGESFAKLPNLYAKVIEFGASSFKNRKTSHKAHKFREKAWRGHRHTTVAAIAREINLILQRSS